MTKVTTSIKRYVALALLLAAGFGAGEIAGVTAEWPVSAAPATVEQSSAPADDLAISAANGSAGYDAAA